jgi:hypothetical protein
MTGVDQGCFSGDSPAEASPGSDIRLRCAAPTAIWSFAMSFSLKGGGVASPVFGRPSSGRPSFVPFDMSPGLHSGARGKMPVNVDVHKRVAVEVRRGWNALDGTVRIMLSARVHRLAAPDGEGRRDGEGGLGCRVIFDFRFVLQISRLSAHWRLNTASYAAWVFSITTSNSSRLIFRRAMITPGSIRAASAK